MNFTLNIKKELIDKKINKKEILYLLNGLFYCNMTNNNKNISIKLMNDEIFKKIIEFIKKCDIPCEIRKRQIIINNYNVLEINSKYASEYFAGIFLSSGSISNLDSSSYHLEVSFKNEENCNKIMDFAKKHIHFNKITKKNYFVLYLKKNEIISDFLQIMGAQKSYFIFIDSIIERDLKNQITRIFNLDVHNQNRLVDSTQIFLDNLNYISQKRLWHFFTDEQIRFFNFKKKNRFLSLSQLSEELAKIENIKKTKSGLNHWLIKLRNVVEEHQNKLNHKIDKK